MRSPKVCFDRHLPRDIRRFSQPSMSMRDRMAVLRAKKWPNGSTLRVRFLGGDAGQRNIVQQFAAKWCKFANLKFQFDDAADAHIRISFLDDGAWSYIGTDCLDIPSDQATMNFGWLDEGVVLHEFGHAIGLIHEHQNPVGGIKWNKPNVYRDLGGSPNFWSKETVDHNMFAAYDRDLINGTELDKKSIMLYTVRKTWTLDGFESTPNDVLSETDKTFIGTKPNYPMDQPAGPTEIAVAEGSAVTGDIGQAGEQDLYKFTANKEGRYTIETEGPTDIVMSLYGPDSQTKLVAEDDDSGTNRNAKIVANLTPGAYFAQVRHFNASGGTGSYTIRVSK